MRFFSGGASQGLIRELVRELACRLIRELARKLDRKLARELARELARAPPQPPHGTPPRLARGTNRDILASLIRFGESSLFERAQGAGAIRAIPHRRMASLSIGK